MLSSKFGKAPVVKVKVAGSVAPMRSSTEPFDLKPASASGLSLTVPLTSKSLPESMTTRPSFPSSRPSFSTTERVSSRSCAWNSVT